MDAELSIIDWVVFFSYFLIIALTGWYFSLRKVDSTNDFFLGGNQMPMWLVAISVLATAQSAATFLGGPDQGYRSNLSYLATNIGTVIAAIFVAKIMIPKFYQHKVTTVYELLEIRFGERAKKQAGLMYLFGRVFASGARLYMAAIAVAMILFGNIEPQNVVSSILILTSVGLIYSFVGGIRSVIYSDAIQCAVYVGAALSVVIYLISLVPGEFSEVYRALENPIGGGQSKFTLLDFSFDFSSSGVFTVWAAISGFVLLGIASFGMDQDMTQRVLTCKNSKESARAMLWSVVLVLPVVFIFVSIGLLLYVFYHRPELMGMQQAGELVQTFDGEKITIFMTFVLNEMPSGLRGLVTVGIVAAALSTLNSGLNSMSSVVIQDFYRPWIMSMNKVREEAHFVFAGRVGMLIAAISLAAMAILSFYWQRYTDTPLLAFALSVMVFSYSGLLGVYFNALFTKRGNANSVLLALIVGFVTTLLFQSYIQDTLNISWLKFDLAFPYQLCIASLLSFIVCYCGSPLLEEQNHSRELKER